jgi:hypothetical protein
MQAEGQKLTEIIIREERHRKTALDLIASIDLKKVWRVELVRYVKKRSNPQNALIHKWFTEIANEIGDDSESVKYDLKMMFLPKVEHISRLTGEVKLEPKGTSELDAREMSEFMEKITAFAGSQLGIALTHPEDMHLQHLN